MSVTAGPFIARSLLAFAVRCLTGIREPLAAGFGGVLKITLVSTQKVSGLNRARWRGVGFKLGEDRHHAPELAQPQAAPGA